MKTTATWRLFEQGAFCSVAPLKLQRSRLIRALVYLCVAVRVLGQDVIRVTFDGYPFQPPGTAYLVEQYFESSIWFRPLGVVGYGNFFGRRGGGSLGYPENGTAHLAAPIGSSLVFSFANDPLFDLLSVDLAEYSTVVPNAVTVAFVGYHPDGTVVTTNFTTDGIIDGTGPVADFQTFFFGPEFSNLDRVEIPTSGWSLDNLVVLVPEPGTWALAMAGGLLFGARCFRKKVAAP